MRGKRKRRGTRKEGRQGRDEMMRRSIQFNLILNLLFSFVPSISPHSSVPLSLLSAAIAKKGPSGKYFLDRNPDLFAIILEFYRNKALIVPKATPLEALYNELEYFGIDYEEDGIQTQETKQNKTKQNKTKQTKRQ